VFAMLAVLTAQVATGLFADDEIATTGPLYRFVSGATSSLATAWHKQWGQWLILALVAMHIAAIAFYYVSRRTNLVAPMWHGDKVLPAAVASSADGAGERIKAALIAAAAAGLAWWVGSLASP
jgi:cytochrome b